MGEFFYQIDLAVFYFINHTLSNTLFDKFFVFITDVKNWFITYLILYLILIIKGGKRGRISSIILILLVITSDQLSSFYLKNLFARIRPCNVLNDVNLLVGCTNSFSFPSSHAVNNFAVALFFSKLFPKYKWILISVASLIALSRPYVGVHYPSDILGGAIIGIILGILFSYPVKFIEKYLEGKNKKGNNYEN
ncbi:phosphatase PAP2 family protein [Rosettibacter firmus]|uniref:phosphatase PAP2 family protein n=1 Tax=Rosettibacter firmus TaxID=3111522 RepID=UPI00336BC4C4